MNSVRPTPAVQRIVDDGSALVSAYDLPDGYDGTGAGRVTFRIARAEDGDVRFQLATGQGCTESPLAPCRYPISLPDLERSIDEAVGAFATPMAVEAWLDAAQAANDAGLTLPASARYVNEAFPAIQEEEGDDPGDAYAAFEREELRRGIKTFADEETISPAAPDLPTPFSAPGKNRWADGKLKVTKSGATTGKCDPDEINASRSLFRFVYEEARAAIRIGVRYEDAKAVLIDDLTRRDAALYGVYTGRKDAPRQYQRMVNKAVNGVWAAAGMKDFPALFDVLEDLDRPTAADVVRALEPGITRRAVRGRDMKIGKLLNSLAKEYPGLIRQRTRKHGHEKYWYYTPEGIGELRRRVTGGVTARGYS